MLPLERVDAQRPKDAPPRAVQEAVVRLSSALFSRRRQVVRRVLGDAMGEKEAALALLEEVGVDQETRVEGLTEADWLALAAARAWSGLGRA